MSRLKRKKPEDIAKEYIDKCVDQPGFAMKYIDDFTGSGIFATKHFAVTDFLLEYRGTLVSVEMAEELVEKYTRTSNVGSFLYFFESEKHIKMCIDATFSDGFGRMINDSKNGNCKMKKFLHNNRSYLCLFATSGIEPGDQLFYDYGDDPSNLLWRKKKATSIRVSHSSRLTMLTTKKKSVPVKSKSSVRRVQMKEESLIKSKWKEKQPTVMNDVEPSDDDEVDMTKKRQGGQNKNLNSEAGDDCRNLTYVKEKKKSKRLRISTSPENSSEEEYDDTLHRTARKKIEITGSSNYDVAVKKKSRLERKVKNSKRLCDSDASEDEDTDNRNKPSGQKKSRKVSSDITHDKSWQRSTNEETDEESDEENYKTTRKAKGKKMKLGLGRASNNLVEITGPRKRSEIRVKWCNEELKVLKKYLCSSKPPKEDEIRSVVDKFPILSKRSIAQIKSRAWHLYKTGR